MTGSRPSPSTSPPPPPPPPRRLGGRTARRRPPLPGRWPRPWAPGPMNSPTSPSPVCAGSIPGCRRASRWWRRRPTRGAVASSRPPGAWRRVEMAVVPAAPGGPAATLVRWPSSSPGRGASTWTWGSTWRSTSTPAREAFELGNDLVPGTPLHRVIMPPPTFDAATRAEHEARLTATEWAQPAIGATKPWRSLRSWSRWGSSRTRPQATASESGPPCAPPER